MEDILRDSDTDSLSSADPDDMEIDSNYEETLDSQERRFGRTMTHAPGHIGPSSSWREVKSKITSMADTFHKSRSPSKTNAVPRERSWKLKSSSRQLSMFETLPTELLHCIASEIRDDDDLRNLISSANSFAATMNPVESSIWKTRFLARYDYPTVHRSEDFAVAYKLRRFVLRNFGDFEKDECARMMVQLEVLRDMVIEAYNQPQPQPYRARPCVSRNLAAMSSSRNSPWIITFLSAPFFTYNSIQYGHPHVLFDTLQLTLSHLVLSPKSALAHEINTSRENYDLIRVYNYNQSFGTLFTKIIDLESEVSKPFRSELFPNLRQPPSRPPRTRYCLDTYTLLHIRNFWHRHLVDDVEPTGEHTYATMARALMRFGSTPRAWTQPLHEPIKLDISWYGHYSCLIPWPKTRNQLEDRQSNADDWTTCDPINLRLLMTSDNSTDCFWPPAFSSIPAFEKTIGTESVKHHKPIYIRGIAPFVNLDNNTPSRGQTTKKQLKYHPYIASRVRGIIHDIPTTATLHQSHQARSSSSSLRSSVADQTEHYNADEHGIPGWKRIIMVMYKPTTRFLIQVLEHAEEEYGGSFGPQITANNTANIWDTDATNNINTTASPSVPQIPNNATNQQTTPNQAQPTPPTPEQIEEQLQTLLAERITSYTASHSASTTELFSASAIISLEDSFIPPEYLAWDDGTIEYAYAYEGALIPGGKIMLGRWWRCHGIAGRGDGKEVDVDGRGIEVRKRDGAGAKRYADAEVDIVIDTVEGVDGIEASPCKGLERGPFVFWS